MQKRNVRRVVVGSASALVAGVSQAAITTTEVTTAITDAGAACAVVGAAVLVLHVGVKVYKWIRGAM